ncbi:unnamed protein product [Eretmochelys imbricata]
MGEKGDLKGCYCSIRPCRHRDPLLPALRLGGIVSWGLSLGACVPGFKSQLCHCLSVALDKSFNLSASAPCLPILSMRMMQSWILVTSKKTAAVSFCDSLYRLSARDNACRCINWHPEACAIALAKWVFPQPGELYRRPCRGRYFSTTSQAPLFHP